MKNIVKYVVAVALSTSFSAHALTLAEEQAARIAADNAIAQRFEGTNKIIAQQAINLETNSAAKANAAEGRAVNRAIAGDAALTTEAGQIGALAMAASAAAAAASPTKDKPTAISTAVGQYSTYSALSLGVAHLIQDNIKLYGTVSGTQNGKTGAAIAASFSF